MARVTGPAELPRARGIMEILASVMGFLVCAPPLGVPLPMLQRGWGALRIDAGGGEHQMIPHPGGRRAKALRASAGGSVTVEFFSCVLGLLTAPLEDAQIL